MTRATTPFGSPGEETPAQDSTVMPISARKVSASSAAATPLRVDGDSDRDRPTSENGNAIVPKTAVDAKSITLSMIAAFAAILMLRFAQDVIIPVVLAVLVSYALEPMVEWLERWKLPRSIATLLVLVVVVAGAAATVYSLRYQAIAIIEDMPKTAKKLQQELRVTRNGQQGALEKVQQAASAIEATAAQAAPTPSTPDGVARVQIEEPTFKASEYIWWGSMSLLAGLGQTGMILLLVFFLLLSGDKYKRKFVKIAGPTLTEKKLTVQILGEINGQIERFLIVQVFTSALVAAATTLFLWWLGVEQAGVWGLAAGVFNSIPYFGPIIVSGGLMLIGYMQFNTIPMALSVAGGAMAITTLEGWLLTPTLLGRVAEMSPSAIFVGLIFWSWMWGVWGMILAVPMMMVLKAICDRIEDMRWIGELLGE